MTKNRVYVVFRENQKCPSGNEFVDLFFNRKAAEDLIASKENYHEYFIEIYQEPEPGQFPEIFC